MKMQGILENSDLSDCDSNEPGDQLILKNFNEAQSSINRWNTLSSGAGLKYVETNKRHGKQKRAAAENIFSQRSGPTSYF